jgi:hypothetical protein
VATSDILEPMDCLTRPTDDAGIYGRNTMRHKLWIIILAIIGWCLAAGLYFGRVINSNQDPASPAEKPNVADATGDKPAASRPAASDPHDPALVMEWRFDQLTEDLLRDPTGHGYDARIHGPAKLIPSWGGGKALSFDGSGDNSFWHGLPQNCGLSIEKRLTRAFSELSVEAWVRKEPGWWMSVVYRDLWDQPSGFGLYTEWSAGKAVFGHYGNLSGVQSEDVVQDGQWHHVVGTMGPTGDGNFRYRIYVDGELSGEQTGSWGVPETPPEGGKLMIGYPNSTGAELPYKGEMGRVAIFDVELTAAKVKAHFEAQRPEAVGP